MDAKHEKFLEMISNIKADHRVVRGMLDDVAAASHRDAVKQLAILKQLLINHFFVEDFVLYPYIRDRYIRQRRVNMASLSDVHDIQDGREDMVELTRKIEGYAFVGEKVLGLITECMHSKEEAFMESFQLLSDFLRERIAFEDCVLEKRMAPRFEITARVAFKVQGKQAFSGTTIDISRTGCLFKTGAHANAISVGNVGMLSIFHQDTHETFTCKIVRMTEDAIAVQFLEEYPKPLTLKKGTRQGGC